MAETERKTRFVNRVEEFEALKGHLSEMLKGNGRFVVITGEAGMGKTRLVEELKNYAQPLGVKFYKGRCLYIENSDPYLPLIDALNQYFEESSAEKIAIEGDTLTSVGLLPSTVTPAPKSEEGEAFVPIGLSAGEAKEENLTLEKINIDTERDKMFGTITNLLIDISKVHPIALFIDDLQWADTGTLQLIHYIARNIRGARVLLIGAYRPEDLQEYEGGLHPLMEIFQRMGLDRLYYQISLTRLKYEHALELVKDILQNEDISPKFMKRLYFETDGNPFFIEELCNTLLEEGVVKPGVYTWDLGVDWEKVQLPNTIKDVINRRVAKLDETSKKILMYASAIGHEFDFNVLQKAVEMDELDILDPLDKLIGMKLIRESGTTHETYMFEHAQIRAVVYESLSKSRLRIMHKKLGEIIEEIYTQKNAIDDVVFALARHYTLGKVQDKALTYNIKAGEKAKKLFAFQEALTYFSTALQIIEEEGESTIERNKQLIQLLQTTGELCALLGRWDDAIRHFERIVEICNKINDERSRAYALIALGNIRRHRGEFENAKKCFEEALKSFEKMKDLRGIADGYRGLGYILWRTGKYDAAINTYNIAMKNTIQVGDLRRLGTMFIEMGNIYGDKGNASKCEEYYKKAIEELKKVNDLNELARAHNNLGDLYLQEGNYPLALENFEKSREYAEKIGNIDWIGWAFFNMAEVYIRTGEIQKAKVCNTRARHLMESINDRVGLQAVLRIEGIILGEEGIGEEAKKSFEKALALVKELQIPYNEAETLLAYGQFLYKMGEKESGLEKLAKAKEIFESIGSVKNVERVNKVLKSLTETR